MNQISTFFHFLILHFQIFFIFIFWLFSVLRFYGGNFYFSLLFSFIIDLPIFFSTLPLMNHLIIFPSLCVLLTTISLTGFDLTFQTFLIFIHFDFISQFRKGSLYSMIDIIFEVFALFFSGVELRYVVVLLGVNFFACYAIGIATDFKFLSIPFNAFSSCLISFLHTSMGNSLNIITFIFSIILSIPHFPIPSPPQSLRAQNIKTIIYLIITFLLNVYSIYIGLEYHALSLLSDSIMSMCNSIAMVGEIIADVASRMKPSKRFSYGFKRGRVVCDFAVTILLIFVSYDMIVQALSSLIEGADDNRPPPILFFISLISLVFNLFGLFFMESFDINECSCGSDGNSMSVISEFMSASAVTASSFLSVYFGINSVDPYVSLLISFMILIISISQMKILFIILSQGTH